MMIMEITFESQNKAKAGDYLVINYEGHNYTLEKLAKHIQDRNKREEIIKSSTLIYREKTMTYDEYLYGINVFADSMQFSDEHFHLFPIQHKILDFDYNISIKLIKSFEQYLPMEDTTC